MAFSIFPLYLSILASLVLAYPLVSYIEASSSTISIPLSQYSIDSFYNSFAFEILLFFNSIFANLIL